MFKYVSTLYFLHCTTKFAIHSILYPNVESITICLDNSKKTVSFNDILNGIDGDDIVTGILFNGGNIFYFFIRSYQPKRITSDNQISFSNDNNHTISIFLDNCVLWDTGPGAHFSLTHTSDGVLMTIQDPRKWTHQPKTDLRLYQAVKHVSEKLSSETIIFSSTKT